MDLQKRKSFIGEKSKFISDQFGIVILHKASLVVEISYRFL